MRILYVALKESLPGSHGGAVHVLEVARQLARRGHTVTVLVRRRPGQPLRETNGEFELVRLPVRSNWLLFREEPAVRRWIEQFKPDLVMERYYNFSGAGVFAASRAGLPSVLEVNAPLIDPPGTTKQAVDRVLFGWMTRRALAQARAATRIVTPLAATVPAEVAGDKLTANKVRADKVREIPWGANVELFDCARLDPARVESRRAALNPRRARVVAFLGSFRPWHGVRELVQVACEMARERDDLLFLLIGAGELLDELRERVRRARLQERIVFTGAIPYEQVPEHLALGDMGVAPFNTAAHPPLRIGFYWSPLKVHEYMAIALPVVTIDVPGLNQIARHAREGLLYPEGDLAALRAAITRLADDPALARELGAAGRVRVVEQFSWQRHAELLEGVMYECKR